MTTMPAAEGVLAALSDEKRDEEQFGEAAPTIVETKFPLDIAKKEFSIFELHRRWTAGHLRLQPEFQRELVWSEEKQIKLVESVLARIPLPSSTSRTTVRRSRSSMVSNN